MLQPLRHALALAATVAISLPGALRAQEPEEGAETFFEDLEVRVVNVDVLVTDRDGEPIFDLTRDDFRLFEDGKEVPVAYFSAPRRIARPVPSAEGDPVASAPAGGAGVMVESARPTSWIVYLDQTRLSYNERNRALRSIRDFLFENASQRDRFGVIQFTGSRLDHETGITADRDRIGYVLDDLMSLPGTPDAERQERSSILRDINRIQRTRLPPGFGGGATEELADQFGVSPDQVEAELNQGKAAEVRNIGQRIQLLGLQEGQRDEASLRAFSQALVTLGGLADRKVIFRVGGGLSAGQTDALTETLRKKVEDIEVLRRIFFQIERDLRSDDRSESTTRLVSEISRRSNAAGVTVITVDTSGVGGLGLDASMEGSGGRQASTVHARATDALADSLKVLATQTGGSYVRVSGNLDDQLELAGSRVLATYSLGYEPPGGAEDTEYHEIEVKVTRPGARVSHRHGRQDFAAREQAQVDSLSAVLEDDPANPLGIEIETVETKPGPKSGERVVSLKVAIPLGEVTLLPDGAVHRGVVVAHAATRDNDGTVRLLEGREYPIQIPNQQLVGLAGTLAWFPLDVLVRDDDRELSVTVSDLLSSKSSSRKLALGGE